MTVQKKALPPPSFTLVFEPQRDTEYKHFEGALDVPFDPTTLTFSRQNAWWLADASLLAYWNEDEARRRFRDATLDSAPLIQHGGTQCYVAWTRRFGLVAFRGTQADSLHDILTDVRAAL